MRRPVYQLGAYQYNPIDGTMEGDRVNHIDTYQQDPPPPAPPAPSPVAPVVININLGDILAGLGLKDLIQAILDRAPRAGVNERSLTEAKLPRVPKGKLIEAVAHGADPREVVELWTYLYSVGALD
jgi:hypothetical protein